MDQQKARLNEILADTLKEWEVDCPPETVVQITEHLLANGVIMPPCKVGDGIWVIEHEDGEPVDVSCVQFLAAAENFIIATAFTNDYDINETIEYHINETQENYDTALMMYPKHDCFSTREEAERTLREREA